MGHIVELDPRVVPFEKRLKYAGTAVVATVASGVVIVGGLSVIAAGIVTLAALGTVYFVPVGARYLALKKQQALTALAEVFSEETIREDERNEATRLEEQQAAYQNQEAEFGNIIDELRENMKGANDEETSILQGQIDELVRILEDAHEALQQKTNDLVELRRTNGVYISLHRAAKAMKRGQDQQRNAAEIERIKTARNAIKTRMREALAGQKVAAMNAPLKDRLPVSGVAQIAVSPVDTTFTNNKEKQRVPVRR